MAPGRRVDPERAPGFAARIGGALVLAILGLLFAGLVAFELRRGIAAGGVGSAGAATRAQMPGTFSFLLLVQAFTACALLASALRTAGVPLPVPPRALTIAALSLAVLLGAWTAVEFALNLLGLTRALGDDPASVITVRIAGLATLAVFAYLIWEFGISEIFSRVRGGTDEDED